MIIKIKDFIKELIEEIKKDDIFSSANDLTYKIFFSAFPFAIFLMSVVGFLKLDENLLIERALVVLPDMIRDYAKTFIQEIVTKRNADILSFSLIISIYSASSGFRTAVLSINKAYGLKDTRRFYYKILTSAALVLIFGGIIILCFVLLVFGDTILYFIKSNILKNSENCNLLFIFFNMLRYIISVVILFFSVILINKTALFKIKKVKIKNLFAGAVFTCLTWISASALFNIYINNFSNYSAVYGSVGTIIVLMLWINIMCITLLIGSEINAMLEK